MYSSVIFSDLVISIAFPADNCLRMMLLFTPITIRSLVILVGTWQFLSGISLEAAKNHNRRKFAVIPGFNELIQGLLHKL
jgi:hypothetical protein